MSQPRSACNWEGDVHDLPVPAAVLDGDGRVLALSPTAITLLGRDEEDVRGLDLETLLGELGDWEVHQLDLASHRRLALLGAPGASPGDLKRQVYHLSRLATVGQLVSSVVHEINNALTGICGYTQLAMERQDLDEMRADLARVRDETLRTSQVVQGLLRFGRQASQGRTSLPFRELLERCAAMKRRDLALKSIGLDISLSANLPEVEADEALLFQVFLNLINNAEQALHEAGRSGRIEIRARRSGEVVQVEVRDDGPGIPAESRDRIFEPFFTSRSEHNGTGLGLSLCRDILQDHGGSISLVRSRKTGACFRVSLPVPAKTSKTAKTAPRRRRRPTVSDRRIVVVEDESAIREMVTRTFEERGNVVAAFHDGEQALHYLQKERVDLVVSDIHRPGLNGIELYDALVKSRPEFKSRFLFLTGDLLGSETSEFLERRSVSSLRKPLKLEDLIRQAERVLRRSNQQGELFTTRGTGRP